MPQSLKLPIAVAKAFARDMRAYFAERNELKRDEIAARQLHALNEFRRPRDKKLRLADVKRCFWKCGIRAKCEGGRGMPTAPNPLTDYISKGAATAVGVAIHSVPE
jgi:hypothetical protein